MYRAAVVDVGSNAVRLAWVRVGLLGHTLEHGFHRFPIRLGADVFSEGSISKSKFVKLQLAFDEISKTITKQNILSYRAVATSAMREAVNGDAVVDALCATTSVRLEIIDGVEELRLSRSALERVVGNVLNDTLFLDLGGGSLELERADGNFSVSLPIGTVRLLEGFPELRAPLSEAAFWGLIEKLGDELRDYLERCNVGEVAIGTGGNLGVLSQLVNGTGAPIPSLSMTKLPKVLVDLSMLSVAERMERYALREDRADSIVAAGIALLAIAKFFDIKEILVPGTGLRDQVLYELLAQKLGGARIFSHLPKSYNVSSSYIQHCEKLSRDIFNAFSPFHQLWPPAQMILLAALIYRDLGVVLDPENPAAHSSYMVRHDSRLALDESMRRVVVALMMTERKLGRGAKGVRLNPIEKRVFYSLVPMFLLGLRLRHRRDDFALSVIHRSEGATVYLDIDDPDLEDIMAGANRVWKSSIRLS